MYGIWEYGLQSQTNMVYNLALTPACCVALGKLFGLVCPLSASFASSGKIRVVLVLWLGVIRGTDEVIPVKGFEQYLVCCRYSMKFL